MNNVILIGMPGAGKSTLGVLLAKRLCMQFCDTDLLLQSRYRKTLSQIMDDCGPDGFLTREAELLAALDVHNTVIATGGSAIYSDAAMRALGRSGVVVYLRVPCDELAQRLGDLAARGVVLKNGDTLASLYALRVPLYERYADLIADCGGKTAEQSIDEIIRVLERK